MSVAPSAGFGFVNPLWQAQGRAVYVQAGQPQVVRQLHHPGTWEGCLQRPTGMFVLSCCLPYHPCVVSRTLLRALLRALLLPVLVARLSLWLCRRAAERNVSHIRFPLCT